MPQPVALASLGALAANPASGQLWKANEIGGYWYAPNLSKYLRQEVKARCRYRQFCALPDDTQNAKHAGDTFHWNIYSELEAAVTGLPLDEENTVPMSRSRAAQGQVTVEEFAHGVPWSGKLDDLSEHPVRDIIEQQLKTHLAQTLDVVAFREFEKTPLKVSPAGGTSATDIALNEAGAAPFQNNSPLTWRHCKQIARLMRNRDIPTFKHGDYYCIAEPLTYSTVEDDLEQIHKYVESGARLIRNGEKGRASGIRFVEQTNIRPALTADPTSFALNNVSGTAHFFGNDVVAECVVVPEEMRGMVPTDFGRGKGVAYYYLGNFGMTRQAAADMRCVEWASLP